MASLRSPAALRHIATTSARQLRASNQRRWAQVHDVRFLTTTQQPRALLEKYREKLDRKARDEGLGSVEELKAAYAGKIDEFKKEEAAKYPLPEQLKSESKSPESSPPPPPSPSSATSTASSSESPSSPISSASSSSSGVKPLSEILDISKARHLPEKELTAIWRLRNAQTPNSVCAVLPARTYHAMDAAARRNPRFVLPVPREGEGAEIHFLQWIFDDATRTATVMFTQLAEFKAQGEFARPHTTVTHHVDLAEEVAGLVLMQGQVVDGRGASVEDAQWLVMSLQRFYGGWDEGLDGAGAPVVGGAVEGKVDPVRLERAVERRRLLEWFSANDPRFTVDKLLEEAERIG